MKLQLIIEVWKKGKWFLARAPELDFVSQGKTPEEARKNLLEVINIQFEEMKNMGTLRALRLCEKNISRKVAKSAKKNYTRFLLS